LVIRSSSRIADHLPQSPTSDSHSLGRRAAAYGAAVRWLWLLASAGALLALSWMALIVLARRLPPGLARDLASFLPACATMLRRLRRDPRVPTRAKVAVAFAAGWVISP